MPLFSFNFSKIIKVATLLVLIFSWGAAQAATTTSAVGLTVTTGTTTSTTTPPGGGTPISGCIDPLAINYVLTATVDDGSCRYNEIIPNALTFIATYIPQNKNVLLEWTLPPFPNFEAVRIVKAVGRVPISPTDGTLVYDGAALSTFDNNVSPGQIIFYTLFVRSKSGQYSGGLVARVVIPTDGVLPPDEPPDIFPPGDPPPDGTGSGNFYLTQTAIFTLPIIQSGLIDRGVTGIPATVYINYDLLPRSLKTVVATFVSQSNPNFRITALLKANEAKTLYLATVGPLPAGYYDVIVDVLNYDDQSIRHLTSTFQIKGPPAAVLFTQNVSLSATKFYPFLVGFGLLSGLANLLLLGLHFNSLFDLYLLIARALGTLFGFFAFRKPKTPWGTVYDSATKRPIDPAYVVVYDAATKKEVASAITDIDGRFGFLLKAGTYFIQAAKTHYLFPSKILAGQIKDSVYDNLYFGANFTIKDNELLHINIPLDPQGFDWNEFAKTKKSYYQIYSQKEVRRRKIAKDIYRIGFVATILFALLSPSAINFGALGLYAAIWAVDKWWQVKYKPSTITKNGERLAFGVIKLYFAEINQEVKKVIADEEGRFYLLVRPGRYYFTIEEQVDKDVYKEVYRSNPLTLDKGVLPEKIEL